MSKKIRILHCVVSLDRGGLETFIMNSYRHIDRSRFDFDFLVQREGDFEYSDEIKKLGGHIFSVPAFNPFAIRKYNLALDDFFAKHSDEYDIVHAHNNSFAMYVLRAAKKHNISVRIAHSHATNEVFELKKLPFVIYNKCKLKKYCNVQFACGVEAGKQLFGNNNSIIIKNAIDLNKFSFDEKKRNEFRRRYNINDKTLVIGHIGRFCKVKNHCFLINLLKKMKEDGDDVKLLLIGDGELRLRIKEMVEKNGLTNDVIFTGSIDNTNDYLNIMDVFAMPSFHEGLPVTLVEAQANGLTCVVSNRVSDECKITPFVYLIPLSDKGMSEWRSCITKGTNNVRGDYANIIKESGYDITEAVKRLEGYYKALKDGEGLL